MNGILLSFLFILLIALALGLFWYLHVRKSYAWEHWVSLKPSYKSVLDTYVNYYKNLEPGQKKHFEQRCQVFINQNRFKAAGFSYVSDEMKALIAAAFAQLTFGFKRPLNPGLKEIWIYPDSFFEPELNQRYLWIRERPGVMELNWESLLSGYKDARTPENQGLSELVKRMALEKHLLKNPRPHCTMADVRNYRKLAEKELASMDNLEVFNKELERDIRSLTGRAVELFFEKPRVLENHNPQLYQSIAKLLNQNPPQQALRKAV